MILIAGCNGHVGREIVKKAAARNIAARCFDLRPFETAGLEPACLEMFPGDITDFEAVRRSTQGVETVLFVLGLKRQTKELTHEKVECGGMQNLIRAARENSVKHIMYISALGVSPDARASSLIAKWRTEQMLIESGIAYTIFRPSGYFVDFAEHFAPRIKASGKFSVIGNGLTRIQPLAPEDLAEAFIRSMNNPGVINKIFKISGSEVFTLIDTVQLVGRVVGRTAQVRKLPLPVMKVLFSLMALVTGRRGLMDFIYRMSRDSVCTDEDVREVREVFDIEFQRLEPWLREQLSA
ncbi:MAG: NAD(P)H-binding protein [Deltaproteobacteria bacterium]|nr:NAD(P)H-binding protein [Deltaproteobacteria bacterium]